MVRYSEKLELATYYRKRGFSYSEIANLCGVSKSTVSSWLAKKAFSKKVRQQNSQRAAKENSKRITLLNKAKTNERKKLLSTTLRSADTEFRHYRKDPKFIAGITLYMTIGDMKDTHRLRVSTGNVLFHKIFLSFATDFLGVSRGTVRCWLLLTEQHDSKSCFNYWSKQLKLPADQFYQPQTLPALKNSKTLQFGVGNTIIGSTLLKHKLLRWIELAAKELQK